jgi:thiol-disulfide isomerase/thioredoxin
MTRFTLICVLAATLGAQNLSNRRAPSFSLPDSAMVQHDLLDYRGRWLLIDFMKTDCPHCMALSKVMETIKKKYGEKVATLSIVLAPPENQATVAKYVKDTGATSTTIVFDQGQVAVTYFKATPQNPGFDTPHLFIINPNGLIVQDITQSPVLEGADLVKVVDGWIAGRAK